MSYHKFITALSVAAALCFSFVSTSAQEPVSASKQWRVTSSDKVRAAEIVSQMTLEEKIDYISGFNRFNIRAVERLGLPQVRMSDATVGVRDILTGSPSTAYPASILAAATWDRAMMRSFGESVGRDCNARGINIILGPGVNIYRSPLCGRNFEYLGEDPYLSGEAAVQYIKGVQSRRVIATVKHFALNNQEWSRHHVSSDADERTIQEIYFPAFRKAVQEGGAGAVMDSYNLVNSVHASENAWMNKTVLRDTWGFDGIVMSDWTSTYSVLGTVNGGLDIEMPRGVWMNKEKIMPLIENGVLSESSIDEKCIHIIQTLSAFGFLDGMPPVEGDLDSEESSETALEMARDGMVLLKNEGGMLPLSKKTKVAVIGPWAECIPAGGGSSKVTPFHETSLVKALTEIKGEKNVVAIPDDAIYNNIIGDVFTDDSFNEHGFTASYYNGVDSDKKLFKTLSEASPAHSWKYGSPFAGMPDDGFTVEWKGVYKATSDATLRFKMGGDDGYRLSVNGKVIGGDWGRHGLTRKVAFLKVEAGKTYDLEYEFFESAGEATVEFEAGMMDDAKFLALLKNCDALVYCATFEGIEGEGFDRPFDLPSDQIETIKRLSSTGKPLAVAVAAGGSFETESWLPGVQALINCFYPGQEGGRALAEILTGRVNPSGKLPMTFERCWEDNPSYGSYRDKNIESSKRVYYKEGLFIGYRGYDRTGVKPLFPFGYGLSYTTFMYSNLTAEKVADNTVKVDFDITNTGKTAGAEVAQIYVQDTECSVPRPLKELKGFEKVQLGKGETKHVSLTLDSSAFAFYDVLSKAFKVEPGEFRIMVGGSSESLPLSVSVNL